MLGRAQLTLAPLMPLLLAAAVATCEERSYTCTTSDGQALFEDRILPLLEADRPKSCNQCHLSGVDLSLWLQSDACSTMACMIEDGVVDLESPQDSELLVFIDRAQPESEGITDDVIAEERQAMEQWIERAAECRDCLPPGDGSACGRARPGPCRAYDPKFVDPGGCDDRTLEQLFMNTFFFDRGRCYPCHFEQGHPELEAPTFIFDDGSCSAASLRSLRELVRRGYLDAEDPEGSLWLQKPLDEKLGGLPHGGDDKYHALDEPSYVDARQFTRRWAECQR